MRWLLIFAASIATTTFDVSAINRAAAQTPREASPQVVLDNARVRVYRGTAGNVTGVEHGAAVIVPLEDGPGGYAGDAVWVDDAAATSGTSTMRGSIVIVQLRPKAAAPPPPPPPAGSKPGEAPFIGMSFNPLFENDRVSVLRARMNVGASEGFHTHSSDTLVIHLSGGEIEDTADGKTVVNRWKHGDVEFEGLGTSHSARNIGAAVDVVLVALNAR
jgi:quercetin dioxygenase-like cupin family protein